LLLQSFLTLNLSVLHLSVLNLSVYHLSVHHSSADLIGWPIRLPALLFPPHPPSVVDSLGSELCYRSGCRAAFLASCSTEAVGQCFRQLSPRGARSKGDRQPDGRVPTIQKLQTSLVSIQRRLGRNPPIADRYWIDPSADP
jgi:hypothetical protein